MTQKIINLCFSLSGGFCPKPDFSSYHQNNLPWQFIFAIYFKYYKGVFEIFLVSSVQYLSNYLLNIHVLTNTFKQSVAKIFDGTKIYLLTNRYIYLFLLANRNIYYVLSTNRHTIVHVCHI